MRILVCGGRYFTDKERLWDTLDATMAHAGIDVLIYGCAKGAQEFARQWAVARGVVHFGFPPASDECAKTSAPIRNLRMLREGRPDFIIAFPPPNADTADLLSQAEREGVDSVTL